MRLVDTVSLRSRERKLRLFLDELHPTPETSVLDVGADELGFGEGDGCGTLNFFEEHYPWPERITALGLHDGAGFRARYPDIRVRAGRRVRAALRRRRVRHRLLERRHRARRRARAPAAARLRGDPRRAPRVHHDAEPSLPGRGAHAASRSSTGFPTALAHRVYRAAGKEFATEVHLLTRRSFEALFPGRVRIVSLGLTLVAIVD